MHILQTPVRISAKGGVERYVRDLSTELTSKGHRIEVVCSASPHMSKTIYPFTLTSLTPLFHIANTEITPFLLPTLLFHRYDLIHSHIPTPWSVDMSMLATWLKKKPLVVTYHNDIAASGLYSHIAAIYNKVFLPLVFKKARWIIITRLHYQSPLLQKYYEKLIYVPPGVNVEMFKPEEHPKIGDLFFLSVLDEYHTYKGIDNLFSVLQGLKHEFPEIRLIVGGSGALSNHYQKKANDMGIGKNVSFAGYIPEDDLKRYYCGTSVFVLPSTDPTREGFGLVLLEAMACGRPVIATDVAGMADDIKKFGSGIIIPRLDPDALSKAIAWFMTHPKESEAMGRAGRNLIEELYDWKVIASRLEDIYSQCIR